jgi:hypothetical protein
MEMSFVSIKARIAEDWTDERRSYARLPVELEAKMRELGANGVEVGSRVWLMLPGRERANAVVKWTAGDKIGAEFAEPVSLEGLNAA